LVNPGTVNGWSPFWADVQGRLLDLTGAEALPTWLGATYTSIVVAMIAATLLGRIRRPTP